MNIALFAVIVSLSCHNTLAEFELDEGKCHSDFVACESVCEFTCATGSDSGKIRELAAHPNVTAVIPWNGKNGVSYVDRRQKSVVVGALERLHALSNLTVKGSSDSHGPEKSVLDKLERYALIAHNANLPATWPCHDNCRYECMQHVSSERDEAGLAPLKFFGKWPFKRVFICQEILSSVYSILNGIPYIAFTLSSVGRRAFLEYRVFGFAMSFAWIASAVFHCRDCTGTMYADYFSAVAGVITHLALGVIRLTRWNRVLVELFFFTLWALHVCYLLFVEFNFDWNMTVAIALAASSGLTWLIWFIRNRAVVPHAWMVLMVTWGTSPLLVLFELNDFPPGPMGLADAHSYWHLTTIPISAISALFLYKDTLLVQKKSLGGKII